MSDPDSTLPLRAADLIAAQRRSLVSEQEILRVLTARIQTFHRCEKVRAVRIYPLDAPDSEGCNWSSSIVLEPLGVPPEVYALAYAEAVKSARERYNLA